MYFRGHRQARTRMHLIKRRRAARLVVCVGTPTIAGKVTVSATTELNRLQEKKREVA